MSAPRILIVLEHYLPGIKAGGPVRSVADLVDRLGDEFAFDILAADRDLGDAEPYANIVTGQWVKHGKARVRYLAPHERTLPGWRRVLTSLDAEVLYLNSLFARSTIKILLLRRLAGVSLPQVVLAPRGELLPGPAGIHWRRKAAWLRLSQRLGLYRGLLWQAASEDEAEHIVRTLGEEGRPAVRVARQVSVSIPSIAGRRPFVKKSGEGRVLFVSRISRVKNLDYALRVLAQVRRPIVLDVYGPVEDEVYWAECRALIERLPAPVTARYRGVLGADEVFSAFARYDLLFLPTRGESFCRVAVEALVAGCPVLLSDRTPWSDVERDGAGWLVPLDRPGEFAARLEALVDMAPEEYGRLSAAAANLGGRSAGGREALEANRALFIEAAGQGGQA